MLKFANNLSKIIRSCVGFPGWKLAMAKNFIHDTENAAFLYLSSRSKACLAKVENVRQNPAINSLNNCFWATSLTCSTTFIRSGSSFIPGSSLWVALISVKQFTGFFRTKNPGDQHFHFFIVKCWIFRFFCSSPRGFRRRRATPFGFSLSLAWRSRKNFLRLSLRGNFRIPRNSRPP